MEKKEMHFLHLMLLIPETPEKYICTTYGDGDIAESIFLKWLARFRSGNIDLEYQGRSSRDVQIKTLIKNNWVHATLDIEEILLESHMSIVKHLKTLGVTSIKIFNGLHCHLWFLHKHNKKNDPFFKRRRWKIDRLQQCGTKKILQQTKWATINYWSAVYRVAMYFISSFRKIMLNSD